MTTRDTIADLKELSDKATAGPWHCDQDQREGMEWNVHVMSTEVDRVCFMSNTGNGDSEANAQLIASLVNAYRSGELVLAAALPGMVVPLEWECTDWSAGDGIEGENDCEWAAEIWPNTSYIISWFGGERFEVNTPIDEKLTAASLKAAIATANAHHVAQVMAALGIAAPTTQEGAD